MTVNQTATEDDLKAVQENTGTTFSVDKLGPRLDHIFSLNNRGPSPVKNAKVCVCVCVCVERGKKGGREGGRYWSVENVIKKCKE